MNNKYRYLIKNIGLLTISNFGGRILSFILVPLYTSILTTTEYGTYDFYTTTVSLLVPILSVCINDAVLRFTIDKKCDNPNDVCTVGFRNMLRSILIFGALVLANYFFNLIPTLNEYPIYLFLFFVAERFYGLLNSVARGIDRVNDYAISGLINSAVVLGGNILFLVVFKWGIGGYFIAHILANFVSALYLTIRIRFSKYINLHLENKNTTKEMEAYSKPFILNSIAWWINNVSDRYIIIWLCGTSANGIYSVAYKIPSIINAIEAIVHQAWTLSAVKEFDDENKSFYSETYNLYNFGLIFACSVLIILDQLLARILYAKDFYTAWKYVPFLIISVLFACLGGHIGAIFSAAKDSKVFAQTTGIGAIVNVALNIALVKYIGVIGAAVATMVSYCVVWVLRLIKSRKYIKLELNLKRDAISYIILLVQSVALVAIENFAIKYAIQAICLALISVLYFKEFKIYFNKALELLSKLKGKMSK